MRQAARRYKLLSCSSEQRSQIRGECMVPTRIKVDPVRHVIGSAMLWGGAPEKDSLYLPITPERNDGGTIYKLIVRDVPVDGFWSITVYNSEGYIEPNAYGAYSVNNYTAIKGRDGSVAIQFGG